VPNEHTVAIAQLEQLGDALDRLDTSLQAMQSDDFAKDPLGWARRNLYPPRPVDSVALNAKQREAPVDDRDQT